MYQIVKSKESGMYLFKVNQDKMADFVTFMDRLPRVVEVVDEIGSLLSEFRLIKDTFATMQTTAASNSQVEIIGDTSQLNQVEVARRRQMSPESLLKDARSLKSAIQDKYNTRHQAPWTAAYRMLRNTIGYDAYERKKELSSRSALEAISQDGKLPELVVVLEYILKHGI